MTAAAPDRLDRIESAFEKIDRKLDAISADQVEIKISQAKTEERLSSMETRFEERFNSMETRFEERFNAIDQRFDAMDQRFATMEKRQDNFEERSKSQDNRLWSLIAGVVLALFGLLVKMAFFPTGQLWPSHGPRF